MEPNAPLAYAPGLEFHHPTISMLGGIEDGYRDREREREIVSHTGYLPRDKFTNNLMFDYPYNARSAGYIV